MSKNSIFARHNRKYVLLFYSNIPFSEVEFLGMSRKLEKRRTIAIKCKENGKVLLSSVRWCSSTICRLVGLQFHRPLKKGEGIILVQEKDTKIGSSIHMFFVFFPIAAVWVNSKHEVTHAILARPWRPFFISPVPACFVIETTPDFLKKVSIGDTLEFS